MYRVFFLAIFTLISTVSCSSSKINTQNEEPSKAISDVMLLCSGGLDKTRRVFLKAQLERRGGNIDTGYESTVRNAILAMVKDMGVPQADLSKTATQIQKQYLDCVKEQLPGTQKKSEEFEKKKN